MEPLEPWRIITQLVVVPLLVIYCWVRQRTEYRVIPVCIVAMIFYGVLQDQVSVRLSREYFTVAHPPIEGLEDPTVLGLAWGFLGSWWGGMLLGIALGAAATWGKKPPLTLRELLPGIVCLMLVIFAATLLTGMSAYQNGRILGVHLGDDWAQIITKENQLLLFVVGCAHFATYVSSILGSVVLCFWAVHLRTRKQCEM